MGSTPQAALSAHTENLIWGLAKNYHDNKRSCGGSSGGDAGMVAARCVPLGVGTDLGSSIRIPATFNGIVGFKPPQRRFTNRGAFDGRKIRFVPGNASFPATMGPLAHSARDCIEFFKVMCNDKQYLVDPFMAPTSFD